MEREARVAFTIVSKLNFLVGETPESVLIDIVDLLDDEIARVACNKIDFVNNTRVLDVVSSTLSPIFYNEKNRPYIVKDFIFTYVAND